MEMERSDWPGEQRIETSNGCEPFKLSRVREMTQQTRKRMKGNRRGGLWELSCYLIV
jgi:hypothetical protein